MDICTMDAIHTVDKPYQVGSSDSVHGRVESVTTGDQAGRPGNFMGQVPMPEPLMISCHFFVQSPRHHATMDGCQFCCDVFLMQRL